MTLARLADMGMIQAILRWGSISVSKGNNQELYALLKFSFMLAAIGIMIVGGAFAIAAERISDALSGQVSPEEVRLFLLALPLIVTAEILASVARAHRGVFVFYSIKGILPSSALLVLVGFCGIWSPTLPVIILCFMLSYLVAVLYGFSYLKRKKVIGSDRSNSAGFIFAIDRKAYIRFGFAAAAIAVLEILRDRVPVFLIGKMITASEAGIYFNAGRPAILMVGILSGLNAILSPRIAVLHHAKKINDLNTTYRSLVRWAILVTFPMAMFMLLEPQLVMSVLFGMDMPIAGQMLFWLALFRLAALMAGAPRLVLQMSGHPKVEIWISVIGLALMIPAFCWALQQWGSVGGIIAAGIVMLFANCIRVFSAWKIVGVLPLGYKEAIILLGLFFAIITIKYALGWNSGPHFLLSCMATAILALVALATLASKDDKQLLFMVVSKFRSPKP